jgi:hypothetical protein
VHGYTINTGDVDGFYQAAKQLCAQGAGKLRAQLGTAGRKRAVEHYDNEANTKEMVAHYKQIMGRPSSTIQKLSLRWFWIDLFANVVLLFFIVGCWVLKIILTAFTGLIALFGK